MRLTPEQIDIPKEKIVNYLLVQKEKNDKSKFLFLLGYSANNIEDLMNDIKNIAVTNDLIFRKNQ